MIPKCSNFVKGIILSYPTSDMVLGWKVKGQGHGGNKCMLNTNDYYVYANAHLTDNSNTAWVWTLWVPSSFCCKHQLYSLRYVQDSFFLAHGLGAVVAMRSGTVPVARHWFRIECYNDAVIFSNSMQKKPSHPQMVAHFNSFTRPDLHSASNLYTAPPSQC